MNHLQYCAKVMQTIIDEYRPIHMEKTVLAIKAFSDSGKVVIIGTTAHTASQLLTVVHLKCPYGQQVFLGFGTAITS